MSKSCPKGQYYCYTDKKCKKIPKGYMIGARGYLRQEPQEDDSKKNGNGNGNGHSKSNGSGRNGGGNGNGNSGGNGSSGGVSEATMTSSQKRKDTMLKKKYDDSDMKKNMKKQYGKEEGEKVYYATIRKQAMESNLGKLDEVGYYSGQDRDPNTGLPKGLKSIPGGKKDKPLKTVPHEILRAHTEIPVTDIKVSSMDELTDYRSFAAKAQEARDKEAKRREEKSKADKDYMARKKERVQKGIKFYDKKGSGYIKGGVKTYNESAYTDFAKKFGLDPVADYAKIKRMMRQQNLRGVNTWSKGPYNKGDKMYGEGTLHKWFKGSKSKDGKPGWVNVKTGGTCASDEPGEGTPKCVSSSKRASMSKAERESASRRKKAADPGQQSKTNAAKPTYVSTDKPKKKMKEENQITEADKKGKGSGTKDACYHKVKSRYSVWPSAYASGALVKCRKVGAANWGNSKKEEFEGNKSYNDFMDEAKKCWKGYKKTGTQKLFGKTYNRCEKEETQLEDSRLTSSNDMQSKMYADKNKSGKKMSDDEIKKQKGGKEFLDRIKAAKSKMKKEEVEKIDELSKTTTANYLYRARVDKDYVHGGKMGKYGKARDKGIKRAEKKLGKKASDRLRYVAKYDSDSMRQDSSKSAYPRKIKVKEETELEKIKRMIKTKMMNGKPLTDDQIEGLKAGLTQGGNKVDEGTAYGIFKGDGKRKLPGDKKKKVEEKVNLKDKSSQYARSTKEVDTAMTDHVNRTKGRHYGKDGKVTEVGRYRKQSKREARNELISMNKESKSYSQFTQECWKTHKKVGMKMKGGKLVPDCRPKNEEVAVEGAAWTKKSGKNKEGGLNEKGRKSYERENPGSDLKAPTKKVGNPRRASFCARMKGMKKKLTSSKTANDPDSRINKSLRKWNC